MVDDIIRVHNIALGFGHLGALNRSSDRATFEEAILLENRSFLSSSDPAARVRAFDWLQPKGEAPEGYDPLASREARREALDLDEEKRRAEDRR